MLAAVGYRTVDASRERIDSLELARLVHELERRYGIDLDLDDDELAAMSTVSGAAELLGRLTLTAAEPE
ncbi:hypothetical protein DDE19_30670 [Micromonospora ureilytica]|uniref:Carrier domain-containing protein n=1 Tax=Micromonospora ureilytica TaxID=709868 RepID=A0A3N9XVA9_9ACTN|nr:hypothetical protein DDE19_30670 [Micromonospora ureilytica]